MNVRGAIVGMSVVGLMAAGITVPAQAATQTQMRDALLTQAQISRLVPDTSGRLSGRLVTDTSAYYTGWEATESDELKSVTNLSIASLNRGRARPRDVPVRPAPFAPPWKRIIRTDDRLVQYREAFAGEEVRVTIFRGRNAVSVVCEQVASIGGQPAVPRKQLRACAATVAKAQFDRLLRVVG